MADATKILLDETEIPQAWFNIVPVLPHPPAPPLHPGHAPADWTCGSGAVCSAMRSCSQEGATEQELPSRTPCGRFIACGGHPSLSRSRLEKALDTPAILLQIRGCQPGRQPQAQHRRGPSYYNKQAGIRRLATETGAGQCGSALALAGAFFDLQVKVYMVRVSYEQKPYRRHLWRAGGTGGASPSPETKAGRRVLAGTP